MVAPSHYQLKVQFTETAFVGDSTNIQLLSPEECGLEKQAAMIASTYNEVINHLFAPNADQYPGNRRLQYTFAAVCAGLSRQEWEANSEEVKERLRKTYSSFYTSPNHEFALEPPALVVYIGPRRESSNFSSPPSVQKALSQETGNSGSGEGSKEEKFASWDKAWDEVVKTSELPCTWGWHVRADGARVIFISGFFALWSGLYQTRITDAIIMTTFLKLVLFHELCHATRSALYGSAHLTPEKCVAAGGLSAAGDGRLIGEAGRLAEELAFGFVVGLHMDNCELMLYACDSQDPHEKVYELTPPFYLDLFSISRPTPLPAPQHLGASAIEIPSSERLKKEVCNQMSEPLVRLSCARPSLPYIFSLRAVNGLEAVPEPLGHSLFLKDKNWKTCIG
ncbi:hypothetical protein C8J56DRAFT_920390 [Mycena floridula]|nr:hypothetical protein C8J56DRAFT_920390 [Mycena floridula]